MSARRQQRKREQRERQRQDYDRIWEEPDMHEWLDHVVTDMAPKLSESAFCISIAPGDDGHGDAKYWVELGASIMMNKPIIVMVRGDGPLPEKLRLVADEIVRVPLGPFDEVAHQLMGAAIKRMKDRLDAR